MYKYSYTDIKYSKSTLRNRKEENVPVYLKLHLTCMYDWFISLTASLGNATGFW